MSAIASAIPVPDADLRWQQWQADGARHDRTRRKRMKMVAFVVVIGWAVAALIQLS